MRFVRGRGFGRIPIAGRRLEFESSASPRLPEECACCGEPSTHRRALEADGGFSLLVGYCAACAEHQAHASSRVLALGLASSLLALSVGAGLPLLLPRAGPSALLAMTLAAAFVPLGLLTLPGRRVVLPHTARGPAVVVGERVPRLALSCASVRYAGRIAELNRARTMPALFREAPASLWVFAGPVAGLFLALLAYFAYHPRLRILNLGPERVEVALDGEPLGAVEATSNESPAAGILVRVPAGERTLSVVAARDHRPLDRVVVRFHGGVTHLFAFGAKGICFWLETTGYGRDRAGVVSYEPLVSPDDFWVLPDRIDSFFEANPPADGAHSRNSGGYLTALRQAPCAEAPGDARRAP